MNISNIILTTALIALTALSTAAQSTYKYDINNINGEDYTAEDGKVVTHAVPDGYPYNGDASRVFNLAVDGHYSGLYSDANFWGGRVAFTTFEFEEGREITIDVACRSSFTTYEILPKGADVYDVKKIGNAVTFKTTKPDQKLTLVLDDKYTKDVIHIFAMSIDKNAPAIDAPDGYVYDRTSRTYYFGPGYHKLTDLGFSDNKISISGSRKMYVAAGAVVDGCIGMNGCTGASVTGRGMVVNNSGILCAVDWSTSGKALVEGITFHGHRAQSWCLTVSNCTNVTFRNLNLVTTRYASTDGIDIINSQDCTFENCFLRSADDAIAIKGLWENAPADCWPNKNLTFNKLQVWNDCNNALGIGAETRASSFENIRFTDCDILFSYDDCTHHEELDERSAMNICALNGTYFRDIVFENIRVNRCERLIGLGYKADFWFGSLQGDQTTPGEIADITFRNIECPANSGSSIANEIRLYGWDGANDTPVKPVHDITFDNVVIEGELLASEDNPLIITNNTDDQTLVYNLYFTNTSGISAAVADKDNPSGSILLRAGDTLSLGNEESAYEIYNLQGQLIKRGLAIQISADDISRGIYLLRYHDSGKQSIVAKRLVKQ